MSFKDIQQIKPKRFRELKSFNYSDVKAQEHIPLLLNKIIMNVLFFNVCVFSRLHHAWVAASRGVWDLVPRWGIEPGPLHWDQGVLATRPPRKSLIINALKPVSVTE